MEKKSSEESPAFTLYSAAYTLFKGNVIEPAASGHEAMPLDAVTGRSLLLKSGYPEYGVLGDFMTASHACSAYETVDVAALKTASRHFHATF